MVYPKLLQALVCKMNCGSYVSHAITKHWVDSKERLTAWRSVAASALYRHLQKPNDLARSGQLQHPVSLLPACIGRLALGYFSSFSRQTRNNWRKRVHKPF